MAYRILSSRGGYRSWCIACVITWAVGLLVVPAQAQWSTGQLLNHPSESGTSDIKEPRLAAAASGGFHAVYGPGGLTQVKYRRYYGGSLGPVVHVYSGFAPNQFIAEADNGDVHIAWEDWDGGLEIGWTRSTNGGISFAPGTKISACACGSTKFPQLAPLGGAEMLESWWRPTNNNLYYQRFNGSSWTGSMAMGTSTDNQYAVTGIARSPVDGSIWRAYARKVGCGTESCYAPCVRRFNGSTWDPEMVVHANTGFIARLSVAVNGLGQVMVVWDKDNNKYSKLYTPGSGWGALTTIDSGVYDGNVVAVPGNFFYVCYVAYECCGYQEARGRMWTGASWSASELISQGVTGRYTPNCRVTAGPDGTIYGAWESWTDKPVAYYSVRAATNPPTTGTIAGTVQDQFGAGVSGVNISTSGGATGLSGAGGSYTMNSPTGTFFVQALKNGYTGQTQSNITVTQNQTTTVNFVITGQAPAEVSNLTIASASTVNTLYWTNPTSGNLSGTRIMVKTGGPPTGPTDGTLLTEDFGAAGAQRSFAHTALTNGQTRYYKVFTFFSDASRFYSAGLGASATPATRADFDRDGDVDQADFGRMQACLLGPSLLPGPGCGGMDFGGDQDVDNADMELFLACVSGPGAYADVACLP